MLIPRRASGILLHITSLPSRYGIGDLGQSAYDFVDFLKESQQRYWQTLPLSPTRSVSGHSPYDSTSAFAGNPLLLSPTLLQEEGFLQGADSPSAFPDGEVDYAAVTHYKEQLLSSIHSHTGHGKHLTQEFLQFCEEEQYWLEDYALFATLKKHWKGAPWNTWPEPLRTRTMDALQTFARERHEDIEHEQFLQFLFFRQWQTLRKYCADHGIALIGDLPLYVSEESADVWAHPSFFKLNAEGKSLVVSGAPPDAFNPLGQCWGTPVYDWNILKAEGYSWWVKRIVHHLRFCDILRLDHFRGFAAYWEIPAHDQTAKHGSWAEGPRDDLFQTIQKQCGSLPFIAEDLGVITEDVTTLRNRLGIPGMRILQFSAGTGAKANLHHPDRYTEDCVAYTSTHDSDTLVGWIATHGDDAIHILHSCKQWRTRRRPEGSKDVQELHWQLIELLMDSKANLVIVPLQDILGLGNEARMNRPGTTEGNWLWRMEAGAFTNELAQRLAKVVKESDRV